ncbi:MAG: hypothetical protein A3E37_04115 [Candidatus Andersenbacteria bacterium RIFCSPHIGHO2_12_FULL_46_9]|nr:MAG: hypothetical protein A3B76_00700 [Candidatus Andersenbacteria bacterium RIFCSPHIGHO2_02_FULL_46_16]OGY37432.1 MAG: hypothetical protein A3I08_00105 [Candidatus Andersenbacteria bacterium RIFCSPLOWO2_02_FULL_46_11]OGY37948.1 MAG: hypothetical protein A3E37_04115 [Candidatus Andersenbacteria bacterium RIFCSPHIGHO2_12_FULL_46_9]
MNVTHRPTARLTDRTRLDPVILRICRRAISNAAVIFFHGHVLIINGHCIVQTVMGKKVSLALTAAAGCHRQVAHKNTVPLTALVTRIGEEEWICAGRIPHLSAVAVSIRQTQ